MKPLELGLWYKRIRFDGSTFDASESGTHQAEAGHLGKTMSISRRKFLRAGFGVGTTLLLPNPVCSASPSHGHEPVDEASTDFKPGASFLEPEVRRSANGELNTTLRMQYAYKDIGGYRLYVRTYEGTVPGPTLLLKPGRRAAHQTRK
jgi:hypothetical protein